MTEEIGIFLYDGPVEDMAADRQEVAQEISRLRDWLKDPSVRFSTVGREHVEAIIRRGEERLRAGIFYR